MKSRLKVATLHIDCWMVLVAFLFVTPLLHAQKNLTVTVTSSLGVLTAAGSSSNQQSMTVTVSWSATGPKNSGYVTTCVYMTAPLTGTGGNPDRIPAADIMVTSASGTSSIVSSGGCGVTTALQVDSTPVSNFHSGGTINISMQFQAMNTGALAADTYTGTINIIAAGY